MNQDYLSFENETYRLKINFIQNLIYQYMKIAKNIYGT